MFVGPLTDDMYLQVADTSQSGACDNIDLLIVADHYWEIVMGSTKHLTPKLMAAETILGWTVKG